jgi:hypothetical protein
LNRAQSNPVLCGDLTETPAARGKRSPDRPGLLLGHPWATEHPTLGASTGEASQNALADQIPLELGEYPHQAEHGTSAWTRSVPALAPNVQIDLSRVEFTKDRQQVGQRPAQAVDPGNNDQIELLPNSVLQQTVQRGPVLSAFGPADGVV